MPGVVGACVVAGALGGCVVAGAEPDDPGEAGAFVPVDGALVAVLPQPEIIRPVIAAAVSRAVLRKWVCMKITPERRLMPLLRYRPCRCAARK